MLLLADGLCFIAFVLVLLPAFLRFAWYYFVTATNRKSVAYGTDSKWRQTLDVYTVVVNGGRQNGTPTAATRQTVEMTHSDYRRDNRIKNDDHHRNTATSDMLTPLLSCCSRGSHERQARKQSDHPLFGRTDNDESTKIHNNGSDPPANRNPNAPQSLRPVVLFVPGGAWMIGYKMWAALTARVLTHFGIVTIVADYRNHPFFIFGCCCCPYPQIPDMVDDVSAAIQWTIDHVAEYGGDPQRIVLVGQSAGGHLVTTALLQRAIQLRQDQRQRERRQGQNGGFCKNTIADFGGCSMTEAECGHPQDITEALEPHSRWRPCDLCGFVSASTPFHFPSMYRTFRRHGLWSKTVLKGMFEKESKNPNDYDPLILVRQQQQLQQSTPLQPLHLPRIEIWQGLRDKTVPWESSQTFGQELHDLQQCSTPSSNVISTVNFRLFETWTHTDAIIEGPLSGSNEFHKELFDVVKEWTMTQDTNSSTTCAEWCDDDFILEPMWCPKILAQLGRFFIPF
ncbi:hypothetical protein ACA910_002086 [Epithemia clementina (nom. ined.)]